MDTALAIIGCMGSAAGIIILATSFITKTPTKITAMVLASFLLLLVVGGCGVATSGADDAANGLPQGGAPGEAAGKGEPEAGPASPTAPGGRLTVHFIDVGQGDAVLIQTPGRNILIDGGERGDTVVNYLKSLGVSSLDLVIGTHPHADHIGGLINVLQSIPVKEVIDPGVAHTTRTFEDYLTLIDQKEIKFTEGKAGMTRDLGGGAIMQILHPASPSASHLNDASIVTRITFGQVSIMLTGDAEAAAENEILDRGYDLNSTILKVGHHGSRTSTTQAFLNAIDPQAAVIMCGAGNRYGHPHEETLQKLSAAGAAVYRTDLLGTIIVTTDGNTYSISRQPYSYRGGKGAGYNRPSAYPIPGRAHHGTWNRARGLQQ